MMHFFFSSLMQIEAMDTRDDIERQWLRPCDNNRVCAFGNCLKTTSACGKDCAVGLLENIVTTTNKNVKGCVLQRSHTTVAPWTVDKR
ncbi:connector enhancer of kinase suppressor of ras 3-like [Sesbania bispinosa]|nr:connector enhancer of kinase suppressor of ras 3-like [Sesbania bispinosa]